MKSITAATTVFASVIFCVMMLITMTTVMVVEMDKTIENGPIISSNGTFNIITSTTTTTTTSNNNNYANDIIIRDGPSQLRSFQFSVSSKRRLRPRPKSNSKERVLLQMNDNHQQQPSSSSSSSSSLLINNVRCWLVLDNIDIRTTIFGSVVSESVECYHNDNLYRDINYENIAREEDDGNTNNGGRVDSTTTTTTRSSIVHGLPSKFVEEYYHHNDGMVIRQQGGPLEVILTNVIVSPPPTTATKKLDEKEETITFTEQTTITVVTDSDQQQPPPSRFLQQQTTGTRTVLAFTISTSDVFNSFQSHELYPYLFDDPDDDHNENDVDGEKGTNIDTTTNVISMQSQFAACSGEQLAMEPYGDGVVDIQLPGLLSDYTPRQAAFTALEIYQSEIENIDVMSVVDHVMFCLPPGLAQFTASAVTSHPRSIYDDMNCARLSVIMHELAHNMGLNHASKHGKRYMDLTGYMGRSQQQLGGPPKCYNAAQHWKLGWYDDLTYTWDPTNLVPDNSDGPQIIHLAPFIDYSKLASFDTTESENHGRRLPANDIPSHYVLIGIVDKIFLQFNLAISFNEGTGDFKDKVVIVNGTDDNVLDGLDDSSHTTFKIEEFDQDGHTLLIEVCSVTINNKNNLRKTSDNDHHHHLQNVAIVSIGLDESACSTYLQDQKDHLASLAMTMINGIPSEPTTKSSSSSPMGTMSSADDKPMMRIKTLSELKRNFHWSNNINNNHQKTVASNANRNRQRALSSSSSSLRQRQL